MELIEAFCKITKLPYIKGSGAYYLKEDDKEVFTPLKDVITGIKLKK
jgi:hypothetical protein